MLHACHNLFFFFSSRRRHTRWPRDWSSDVCSSDLQIQSLEARLNASVALGSRHKGEFLEGTLGPAASVFIPVSGSWRGRAPFAGVRFRRDTKQAGTVGLQIDFAPLKVTGNCSPPAASRTQFS